MDEMLDIKEVVRRTGLTSRTLRYYEARGLMAPLRTHTGRRLYGPEALERINRIVTLKRAGLSLARIEALVAREPPDLARLIDAQIAALAARQHEIGEAMKLLVSVSARLERGEAVDVATFCALIRQGETGRESEGWKREVARRVLGEAQVKIGAERMWAVLERIDPQAHKRECAALFERIEAALPLDLDSPQARALLDEWQELTAPLMAVGDKGTERGQSLFRPPQPEGKPRRGKVTVPCDDALDRIDEWNRAAKAPFSAKVWEFLFTAARARDREG
jgi:DNA-binding transcriptional MerR regulator